MPDEATAKCLLQSLMTFLGGGLVGTLIGHFLAIGRDSRNAKRAAEVAKKARIDEFKGFMEALRSWAERFHHELAHEFQNRVHGIRREAAKIRDDVLPDKRTEFNEAVTALCGLSNSAVSDYVLEGTQIKHVGQDRVCSAIDRLVNATN